ncbi:hypothetical protein ENBRE01_3266 [Enteropsectra breve]|nr:hypothetical protein ENBRE01_3266 [Enteropsectra breve]
MIGISRLINASIAKNAALLANFNDNEQPRFQAAIFEEVSEQSRFLNVVGIPNSDLFEVQNTANDPAMRIVNIADGGCSCLYPKEFGLPCVHACAVIRRMPDIAAHFTNQKRKISSLKQIYSGFIAMVDLEHLKANTVSGAVAMTRRGRPRSNQRIRSRSETQGRRRKTCSLCAQRGHDKRRCTRNIESSNSIG